MARARRQVTPELYRDNVHELLHEAGKAIHMQKNTQDFDVNHFRKVFVEGMLSPHLEIQNSEADATFSVMTLARSVNSHDVTPDDKFHPYQTLFADLVQEATVLKGKYLKATFGDTMAEKLGYQDALQVWAKNHAHELRTLFVQERDSRSGADNFFKDLDKPEL